MTTYDVTMIDDDALPPRVDWAFVRVGESLTLFVKESRATSPRVLLEAWAAYRGIAEGRLMCGVLAAAR